MTAASRVKPEEFFAPQEWALLSARSHWKGLALVAHCWLVIGAAIGMGVLSDALWPITIPLAVMLVGNRQLGLFILMHEAAHGAMHPNRKLNDWVGKWLCGSELHAYRSYHLQHHRFVQQTQDPDLILSAPFPVTRASLRRKMVRDITGQTFYKQRFGVPIASVTAAVTAKVKARSVGAPLWPTVWPIVWAEVRQHRHFLIGNAIGFALFCAAGLGWAWLLMWLLPMAIWLPVITRLRNIAEHALVAQNGSDPLRHARTTHASLLERLVIAPYWVNYHSEHHMFTQIACWNLPLAHRILKREGVTARMELQPGYLAVLRLASSAPAAHQAG